MLPDCRGADSMLVELEWPKACAQLGHRARDQDSMLAAAEGCWARHAQRRTTEGGSLVCRVMHASSQFSCRAHPCTDKRIQAEQVPWVDMPGHLLTGVCRGMASHALTRHQQCICSLASPQVKLRSAAIKGQRQAQVCVWGYLMSTDAGWAAHPSQAFCPAAERCGGRKCAPACWAPCAQREMNMSQHAAHARWHALTVEDLWSKLAVQESMGELVHRISRGQLIP